MTHSDVTYLLGEKTELELVRFTDVGQVRTSVERLSQEYLREGSEELEGELQGVLPAGRVFEFRVADTKQSLLRAARNASMAGRATKHSWGATQPARRRSRARRRPHD